MAGHDDRRGVEVHGALARALHPSTFRLKVSTVGCLGGVRGYLGATWGGVYGVFEVFTANYGVIAWGVGGCPGCV